MEKFGIFEILDALSAFTATKSEQPQEKQETEFTPTEEPSPPTAREKQRPADAFSSLIARQEEISRRIDKNKK